ncbi:MAG: amidohydrolase [Paeniglutamicibacter terrestris]|uniref:Amidohydrolase n=1 Tax=Paeniglutamicibacter terrestris TaxID=2723403 RepID=A0ABX1G5S4_9MICC|nr:MULTISPECIES: amidohydrolase [Paeniglutamicibacter]ASN40266.1 N-acyl-L-amino acid amidohydrolase [Arthrobacter sp. 7749]NKG21394.1 amidohydrolase [Paeniglutamicibacter terrestris]QXQ11042.1 amidohydrolase [Paeniglutamicibacter sp. Y32M11]
MNQDLTLPSVKPWVKPMLDELVDFRREVHANPELSFVEYKTTERIMSKLRAAGLTPVTLAEIGDAETGGYVDIGTGPIAMGLRADIDALPILEETGLDYASVVAGVAHSCGHDIHTTVMLGVALTLKAMDDQEPLGARIRVIFQPAEEKMPGGALSVIAAGILDEVPRILALHCEPRIDAGKIGTRIGAITSASDTIKIELTGRGGHTSRPHLTEDLVFAMSQIAINVPAVLSRRIDVRSAVSVVWGQIHAGSAPNAIPATGYLAGTMRCLDGEAWAGAGDLLDEVVRQVASPYGVEVKLEHIRGVPPVINTEEETDLIEDSARAEIGSAAIVLTPQSMGGEDFAWMTNKVPGAMMRLGTRTPGGEDYDLHRGDYIPDEAAIEVGVTVMAAASLRAIAQLKLAQES